MHNYPIMNKRFMHISNISNSPQTRSANVNATATANWLATAQRTQLTQFWQFVVLFHCESCRRAFNIHIQSKHTQTHRHTRKQCPGAYELSRLRPKWRSRKEKKTVQQMQSIRHQHLKFSLSHWTSHILYIPWSIVSSMCVRVYVCWVSHAQTTHTLSTCRFLSRRPSNIILCFFCLVLVSFEWNFWL